MNSVQLAPVPPVHSESPEAASFALIHRLLDALATSGSSASDITTARKLMHAGYVYDLAATAAREHGSESVAAFFDTLDVLLKYIGEGRKLTPLVDACRKVEQEKNDGPLRPALRKTLNTCLDACLERRLGFDPLTGHPLPGSQDRDFEDSLPCTEYHGHEGEHRDYLGRTWPQTLVEHS